MRALYYAEGFGFQTGVPIEHAWAVTEDGLVIDPTWMEHPAYPVESWQYIGIPFAPAFVRERHAATGCYNLLPQLVLEGGELPPEAIAPPWRSP